MAITRWDPIQDMVPLRDAVNRLVEETLVRPTDFLAGGTTVPMDIYADGDNYVIEAAIPGLRADAIEVSVLGHQIMIRGEYPAAPQERRYLRRERVSGRFQRSVTLPADFDADKIQAHFEHGVIKLIVPKAESAKPRRIALTAGK